MFESPWFLPVAIDIIIVGFGYLTLTRRPSKETLSNDGPSNDGVASSERQWPSCNRWKTMAPIRGNYGVDQQNNPQPTALIGSHNRYVNEFKCHFCGHKWLEQSIE